MTLKVSWQQALNGERSKYALEQNHLVRLIQQIELKAAKEALPFREKLVSNNIIGEILMDVPEDKNAYEHLKSELERVDKNTPEYDRLCEVWAMTSQIYDSFEGDPFGKVTE